jgi:hypothetical protein
VLLQHARKEARGLAQECELFWGGESTLTEKEGTSYLQLVLGGRKKDCQTEEKVFAVYRITTTKGPNR